MTDNEATRIVAEWMGIELEWAGDVANRVVVNSQGGYSWRGFRPCTDPNDEQLVREWARENLTESEKSRINILINSAILDRGRRCLFCMVEMNTGDLTRAVAKVLAERVHAMHTSSERVQEQAENAHVGGQKEADDE